MKRNVIAAILVCLLLLGLTPAVFAAGESQPILTGEDGSIPLAALLEAASFQNQKMLEQEESFEGFRDYCIEDPAAKKLLTAQEITSLTADNPRKAVLTQQEASLDCDLLFRALESAYGAYYYFGDAAFDAARETVMEWIGRQESVDTTQLEQQLSDTLSFVVDAHFYLGNRKIEKQLRHEYFYTQGQQFLRDESGFYKSIDGSKYYLTGCSDDRVTIEPSLLPSGEIVYAPVLFCPVEEADICIITLTSRDKVTRTEVWDWTLSKAYGYTDSPTDYKQLEENGVAYISLRSFGNDYSSILKQFAAGASRARKADCVIVDIRSNSGGNDRYARDWVKNFSGKMPICRSAWSNRRSPLQPISPKDGKFEILIQQGKFLKNDIPIIVLVDDQCASSGESMMHYLKTMENVLVVGTNSAGYQVCGNIRKFTLPHSGIPVVFGASLIFYNEMRNVDYQGYVPNLWCDGKTALDAVLNLLQQEGMMDEATAEILRPQIIPKPEVTLQFDGLTIAEGDRFGAESKGPHEFTILMDGKAPPDYTITSSSEAVCTLETNPDGRVLATVHGSGQSTITVTIDGTDYLFTWIA